MNVFRDISSYAQLFSRSIDFLEINRLIDSSRLVDQFPATLQYGTNEPLITRCPHRHLPQDQASPFFQPCT